MRPIRSILLLLVLANCAAQPEPTPDAMPPVVAEAVAAGQPLTAETLDKATAAETAAALAPSIGGSALGTTTASLGDVVEPGFWVKSTLVKTAGPGRVEIAETGQSAQVDLIPIAEGGTQMSLSTMRALGVGLTDLPQVTLFAD